MSQKVAPKARDSLLQSETFLQLLGGDAVKILKCGICLEFFDIPIVLPCGHTFCLYCLTEMCRHAIRNSSQTSIQDTRIGCPNCRVLIYASPVLERNVTCNFIIQSLIELLRARKERKFQTTAVNTDEVRIGPKIRTPSDSDVARLMQDIDRLTVSLGKRNVVDNAYFEIDEIRRAHLAGNEKKQEETKPHRQSLDHSSVKPKTQETPRRPLLNATPIPFAHQNTTPYINSNNNIMPPVSQFSKGGLYHQPYYRQQQQAPTLWQPHRIPVLHHHLQSRQQQQQHLLGVTQNSPWSEQNPINNSAATSKIHLDATGMLAPGATMMQHQNTQESALPVKTDGRFITNKMAATGATKCCEDVRQRNTSRQQSGHEQKLVCSGRLDNDPAVMSYSCTTTTSAFPLPSSNHAT